MIQELDWLKKWSQYSPHKLALQDLDSDCSYTYQQAHLASQKIAHILSQQFQIKPGDRVALLATNCLETVLLFFAVQKLGAILVPLNFRLTANELGYVLADADPKLLIFESLFAEVLDGLAQPFEKRISYEKFNQLWTQTTGGFKDFLSNDADPVMIIYTSGTTGFPKGAVITQEMIFWNSLNTTMRLNLTDQDKTITFAPFFHTGGWHVLTTPLLHRGATVYLLKKFSGERILAESERLKCTILFGVPTMMDMMARSPNFLSSDLSTIRYAIVGGEPMPSDLIKIWHQKKIPIRQGYGLTEFGPNVFSLNEEDAIRKIGSIGFENFYIQARIIDESGCELGFDEIGELELKGPMCMQGYWRQPKATAATIRNGWLKTGDLVRKDSDGFYFVVSRKKDMIKSGGENIYPAEVERVIRSFPAVKEVAVVGVKDEKWGEVGRAYICAEDHQDLCLEDLQKYCVEHLAKFKIPKQFILLPELPKSDSGKILKRKLLEGP